MSYLPELMSVAVIAIFMAISPGADFVMITRNSIFYGRKAGLFAALGISLAIWVHVAYSIAGLAVIISQSVILFSIIKYLGAAYLIYIGWKTLRAKSLPEMPDNAAGLPALSAGAAFKNGFVTNVLNPKTTIFFLSIFTQVVQPDTPLLLQQFNRCKQWIERVVGGVLIAFGVKVAVTE